MKKMSRLVAVVICLLIVVSTITACGVTVTGISLDSKKLSFLVGGEGKELTATVTPENAKAEDVVWSIEPAGVATLSAANGFTVNVTPVAAGTAIVTVSAKNDAEVKATCEVTVKDPVVNGLKLNKTSLSLAHIFNVTETLTADVTADAGADQTVTWESEDPTIASVAGGVVTAVGLGSTVIKATAGEKSSQCAVSVVSPVEIRTAAEFIAIGGESNSTGYYFLANDIDFTGYDYNGSSSGLGMLSALYTVDTSNVGIDIGFKGTFDGRGFALKNLTVGQTGTSSSARTSIFGNIAASGTVKNVEITGITYSTPGFRSGVFANYIYGKVENIVVSGTAAFTTSLTTANSWDRCGAFAAGVRAGGSVRNVVIDLDTSASHNTSNIYAATCLQQQGADTTGVNLGGDAVMENVFVTTDKAKTATITITQVNDTSNVVRVNADGALVTTAASGDIMIGCDQTVGYATAPNNLAKAVKAFKAAAVGTVDFSKLPAADWSGNVASGATALPTLKDNKATAINVTSIESSTVTLPVDVTHTVSVVAKPATASYLNFDYSVEAGKEAVATWNDTTKTLTTVGAGTIVVTIKWAGNSAITGTCTVTVDPNKKIDPTGVEVSQSALTLWQGMAAESTNWGSYDGTATLTAKVTSQYDTPGNLRASQDIVWSSSDATVASVSTAGLVTGLKKGTTTIKATAKDTTVVGECAVSVSEPTVISTVEQFKAALQPASWTAENRAALSGVYILGADIDFANATVSPIGNQEHDPAGNDHTSACDVPYGFRGIFNGNGHALKNFVLGGSEYNNSLFPGLYGGTLRNFSMIGVKSAESGLNRASLLVNSLYGGKMENIYIEGEMRSQSNVGATATYAYGGTIFGGTGDAPNTLISGKPGTTIRNIVTKVKATGTNNDRTYRIAGRIGNSFSSTNTTFANFFVVTDDLVATGNLNGTSSVTLSSGLVTAFTTANVGSTNFSSLPTDAWTITAGQMPVLKVIA